MHTEDAGAKDNMQAGSPVTAKPFSKTKVFRSMKQEAEANQMCLWRQYKMTMPFLITSNRYGLNENIESWADLRLE